MKELSLKAVEKQIGDCKASKLDGSGCNIYIDGLLYERYYNEDSETYEIW